MNRQSSSGGFTLIEGLVALLVIAAVLTVLGPVMFHVDPAPVTVASPVAPARLAMIAAPVEFTTPPLAIPSVPFPPLPTVIAPAVHREPAPVTTTVPLPVL